MRRIILCVLLTLILMAAGSPAAGGEDAAGWWLKPLECGAIEPSLIDSTLVPPEVMGLPQFSKALCNRLTWTAVTDPRLFRYYIEASLAPTFDPVFTCELIEPTQSEAVICVEREEAVWYRIRCATVDRHFGLPSIPVHTAQDTTPPQLTSLVLIGRSTNDSTWSATREVDVRFSGSDNYPEGCATLWLSEDPTLANAATYPVSRCGGWVSYTLSAGEERKTVYGRLVDRAGNESEIISASIQRTIEAHNYPNPFNPEIDGPTSLVVGLPEAGMVTVSIYDLYGNLVLERTVPGKRGVNDGSSDENFRWRGRNGHGEAVADGGYLCVIKAGNGTYMIKMAVAR